MIQHHPHARNVVVTIVALVLVLTFATWRLPVNAQASVSVVQLAPIPAPADPGGLADVTFQITNNTEDIVTFNVAITGLPAGFVVSQPAPVSVGPFGGTANVTARISIPAGQAGGTVRGLIEVVNSATTSVRASTFFTILVSGPTVTPTLTPSRTPTATTTVGPTVTPPPVCQDGREYQDPPNSKESAMLILVDVPEKHGICRIGDVDWYKFGAVGGKVYTIDIPQMDSGLDLSIDLYDEQGNRLSSNDDFFRRTPTAPDAKDIKPRIQSWTAPRDGFYYILVRDTLDIGGDNLTYTLIVNSESYGPTPVTIPEICRDLFEEDGLPEEAKLITSNEVHAGHVLCPTGDADWVRFFGKAGKVYYLYTDTRPYKNNPDLHNQTEAGADTVLVLADRDGISIIDYNDDLLSGNSLDSEIRFVPTADGFYYAQVKNVGDIGNQFIRYDLVLKLCVPNEECGRAPVTADTGGGGGETGGGGGDTGGGGGTGGGTGGGGGGTSTTGEFLNENTNAANQGFAQNKLKPGSMLNGPLKGFADAAFEQVWQRNDRPVKEQIAARSWAWGPQGLMARTEGYIQSASGLRQVQYFDKARMEINNPIGDRNSSWFVTTGLLVVELTSGKTQIGDNEFVYHSPAEIPIAGDPDDPKAPTYASFAAVTNQIASDRTGQNIREMIARDGQIGVYSGIERPETRLVHFVPETQHNIPQSFWDYLNTPGVVYEGGRYHTSKLIDWVFTVGYPISEPYWTRIRVGGSERDVLVQAFQRRVLTYSPDNPRGWQVEMGNVGRHYYLWRYGGELPSQ